jgi:hypothetical protein
MRRSISGLLVSGLTLLAACGNTSGGGIGAQVTEPALSPSAVRDHLPQSFAYRVKVSATLAASPGTDPLPTAPSIEGRGSTSLGQGESTLLRFGSPREEETSLDELLGTFGAWVRYRIRGTIRYQQQLWGKPVALFDWSDLRSRETKASGEIDGVPIAHHLMSDNIPDNLRAWLGLSSGSFTTELWTTNDYRLIKLAYSIKDAAGSTGTLEVDKIVQADKCPPSDCPPGTPTPVGPTPGKPSPGETTSPTPRCNDIGSMPDHGAWFARASYVSDCTLAAVRDALTITGLSLEAIGAIVAAAGSETAVGILVGAIIAAFGGWQQYLADSLDVTGQVVCRS